MLHTAGGQPAYHDQTDIILKRSSVPSWTRGDVVDASCAGGLPSGILDLWASLPKHRDADPDFYRFILQSRPGAVPFLLVRHGPDGSALLIGRIETRPIIFKLGYISLKGPALRTLEIIPGGVVGLVDATAAAEAVSYLGGMLRRREIAAVILQYADPDTALFHQLAASAGVLMRDRDSIPVAHRFRRLDDAADFLASVSANERSQQRKRERRLSAACGGGLRVAELHGLATLEKLLDDAEHVAARSYQRNIGVGLVGGPETEARLRFLAGKGWLRAWIVYAGAAPVAFWIGTLQGGVFISDYLAYDTAWSKLAPGTFLSMHVLAELHQPGSPVRLVDFGPGEAPYKQRLGNELRFCSTLHVFAPGLAGLTVALTRTALGRASAWARAGLLAFGKLDGLKSALRHRKAPAAKP